MNRDKRAAGTMTPTRSSCTTPRQGRRECEPRTLMPPPCRSLLRAGFVKAASYTVGEADFSATTRRGKFRKQTARRLLAPVHCSQARLSRAAAAPAASAPQAAGPDAIDPAACTVLATRTPHGRPPLGLGEPQARRREEAMRSAPTTTTESRSQRDSAAPRGASSPRPARAAFTHPPAAIRSGRLSRYEKKQ